MAEKLYIEGEHGIYRCKCSKNDEEPKGLGKIVSSARAVGSRIETFLLSGGKAENIFLRGYIPNAKDVLDYARRSPKVADKIGYLEDQLKQLELK